MLGEAARGKFFGKDPILKAAGDCVTHEPLEVVAVCPAVKNHFSRPKRLQPGIDLAQGSLGCEAFAGRNVDQGKANGGAVGVQRGQKVIALGLQ